jgi:hypothetical protein
LEFPGEPGNPTGTKEGWIGIAADIACDKRWSVEDLKKIEGLVERIGIA